MSHRAVVASLGVVFALAVSLSGCGVKLSGRVMCDAHAGTYNAQTKQCTYPPNPSPRSATAICQAQGGTWDNVSDMCAIDQSSKEHRPRLSGGG